MLCYRQCGVLLEAAFEAAFDAACAGVAYTPPHPAFAYYAEKPDKQSRRQKLYENQSRTPMKKITMTPFDMLRQQVRDHPDAVAVATPYRVATYRKMWSRIERSTARLQGEWAIAPGDVIVYLGCGHLDALVMYFAAARCGARILPLEHPGLQADAGALIRQYGASLVLHDDAIATAPDAFGGVCRPLSSLIATACRHREMVLEDSAAVSLIEWDAHGDIGSATVVPAWRQRSFDALAATALTCPAAHFQIHGALFDAGVFAPVVLAAMLAGARLTLT